MIPLDGATKGLTYTGPIYMGRQYVRMDVVFDTGSDWLTVEGQDCIGCDGNLFDGNVSGTYVPLVNDKPASLNYGSA